MRALLVVVLCVCLAVGIGVFVHMWSAPRGMEADPEDGGVDPSHPPIQEADPPTMEWKLQWTGGSATLFPVAFYHIDARVCGVKEYQDGWMAEAAPIDLCLMWENMATDLKDHVRFALAQRTMTFHATADAPVSETYIATHSAVVHIVPATPNVEKAVARLKEGEDIELVGYLVNLKGRLYNDAVWWNSSLVREDTGPDAAELMFVERLRSERMVYQ